MALSKRQGFWKYTFWVLCPVFFLFSSCESEQEVQEEIQILSVSSNAFVLSDGVGEVDFSGEIVIRFSKTLNPGAFESAYQFRQNGTRIPAQFTYLAGATSVEIKHGLLEADTEYEIFIPSGNAIGQDGASLSTDYRIFFTTRGEGLVEFATPCRSASNDCFYDMQVDPERTEFFRMYASYPLFEEQYLLRAIKNLVVVIHGQNRNADEYFNRMMSTLSDLDAENSTLVIAPLFNSSSGATQNELFWNSTTWREGQASSNAGLKESSFEILNSIIERMLTSATFPSLSTITVVGHSSGATLTYLYSGAADFENPQGISSHFDVHNSQYFYYPEDLRWNQGQNAYVLPQGCSAYTQWPYGYNNPVDYLSGVSRDSYNASLIGANVNYFLGTSDTSTTGSLNTSDCEAVLLGEHRFDRGNKLFDFLSQQYGSDLNHGRYMVNNVGHNFNQMLSSAAYQSQLRERFD
jgi:hypothetical protein